MHVNPLTAQELHAYPSMLPATPVTPEQGSRPNFEGVQQHAHLARLCSGTAIPLALLAQWTGTTTANARCIHHPQASIGLSASLMCAQGLPGGATQGAI